MFMAKVIKETQLRGSRENQETVAAAAGGGAGGAESGVAPFALAEVSSPLAGCTQASTQDS